MLPTFPLPIAAQIDEVPGPSGDGAGLPVLQGPDGSVSPPADLSLRNVGLHHSQRRDFC